MFIMLPDYTFNYHNEYGLKKKKNINEIYLNNLLNVEEILMK